RRTVSWGDASMFTKKPEPGESVTKMGERSAGEMKTPFTERPTTYAAKSTSPSASKMVPSIIGEDLSITGNVTSKGEIQVDGEIRGGIHCGPLLLERTPGRHPLRIAAAWRQVASERQGHRRRHRGARPRRGLGAGTSRPPPGS